MLVDVEGLPLRVIVHSAGIQDRDGATLVLHASAVRKKLGCVPIRHRDDRFCCSQCRGMKVAGVQFLVMPTA